MARMLAAVLAEPRRFELQEVGIPAIGPDEALIRVRRAGICGTDVHIFNGHYAADRLPMVPGHEFCGTIAALGRDMHDALTLLSHGRFQTANFTGAAWPLAEIQTAFDTLADRPRDLKTQIILDEARVE
jgi:threonine dehydrogenase-like Zn-dependent dehydrogenase